VNYTFGSFKGLMQTAKAIFFSKYEDAGAMNILNEWKPEGRGPLVQIGDSPRGGRDDLCQLQPHQRGRRLSHGDFAAGTSEDRAVAACVSR
jgi:hypothetical protein